MVAGVVGELAAAGLAAGKLDLDSSSLQQLHGRDTGSGSEEIHHARDEELSTHDCSRLTVTEVSPRRATLMVGRLELGRRVAAAGGVKVTSWAGHDSRRFPPGPLDDAAIVMGWCSRGVSSVTALVDS